MVHIGNFKHKYSGKGMLHSEIYTHLITFISVMYFNVRKNILLCQISKIGITKYAVDMLLPPKWFLV